MACWKNDHLLRWICHLETSMNSFQLPRFISGHVKCFVKQLLWLHMFTVLAARLAHHPHQTSWCFFRKPQTARMRWLETKETWIWIWVALANQYCLPMLRRKMDGFITVPWPKIHPKRWIFWDSLRKLAPTVDSINKSRNQEKSAKLW